MPTYVYACSACNSQFDIEQRITEDALETCPRCEAVGQIKRVIQPVGVMFKGSGFHINDYSPKPAGESETPAAESPAAAAPEPKAEPTTTAPAPTPGSSAPDTPS